MKIKRIDFRLFNIKEEGMYSSKGLGEGRLIPVVVLDLSEHKDIIELIEHHYSIDSGDVVLRWITDLFDKKKLYLKFSFLKPSDIEFGIEFNIYKEFNIIDGIMQSRGVIIQNGKSGDKPSRNINKKSLTVEVPNLGFDNIWANKFNSALKSFYQKEKGLTKREAKQITEQHINQLKSLWDFRQH